MGHLVIGLDAEVWVKSFGDDPVVGGGPVGRGMSFDDMTYWSSGGH